MPAPKNINNQEKLILKRYLEQEFNVTIRDSYDCKQLCDKILLQKKIKISLSTMRRFFDLVKSKGTHSSYILNQFSAAVGFEDFEKFKSHSKQFDENRINQNIQLFSIHQNKISTEIINELIRKLNISSWLGAYQLSTIISNLIKNKDSKNLENIVYLNFQENEEFLIIAFQDFYFEAKRKNSFVIEFVNQHINESENLKNYLLKAYVDEKYLSNFMGDWLNKIKEDDETNILLFKYLLFCQRSYDNKIQANNYLNICNQLSKNTTNPVHFILKGRIAAWNVILKNDYSYYVKYLNQIKTHSNRFDLFVFYCRLIWMYMGEIRIQELAQYQNIILPTIQNYFERGRSNIFLLTLAINSYISGKNKSAKTLLNKFDPAFFGYDIVNFEFYNDWFSKISSELNSLTFDDLNF